MTSAIFKWIAAILVWSCGQKANNGARLQWHLSRSVKPRNPLRQHSSARRTAAILCLALPSVSLNYLSTTCCSKTPQRHGGFLFQNYRITCITFVCWLIRGQFLWESKFVVEMSREEISPPILGTLIGMWLLVDVVSMFACVCSVCLSLRMEKITEKTSRRRESESVEW